MRVVETFFVSVCVIYIVLMVYSVYANGGIRVGGVGACSRVLKMVV